jgi:DNA-binding GntR family transcriptional regulator
VERDVEGFALPPQRTQLKDEAAAHIRELIISGQATSGELLRLSPLAARIGSSITPVREALLLLAQDGWVVQLPNRGFQISEITRSDVEDAYLVHGVVAGELASRAALDATDADLEALKAIDRSIKEHTADDPGFLERANYELHNAVYAMGRSERLTWFVHAASRFVPRRYWGQIPGWIRHNRTGHDELIAALEARDSSRARAAMEAHIGDAQQILLRHLDGIGFWDGRTSDARNGSGA